MGLAIHPLREIGICYHCHQEHSLRFHDGAVRTKNSTALSIIKMFLEHSLSHASCTEYDNATKVSHIEEIQPYFSETMYCRPSNIGHFNYSERKLAS